MQDAEVASIRLADLATGADASAAGHRVRHGWHGRAAPARRRSAARIACPTISSVCAEREWRDLLEVMERRAGRGRGRPAPAAEHPAGRADASCSAGGVPRTSRRRQSRRAGVNRLPRSHLWRPSRRSPRSRRRHQPHRRDRSRPTTPPPCRGSVPLAPPPHHAKGNDPSSSPITRRGCSVRTKCRLVRVEEPLDVGPDVTEVGLLHVGPVGVHALEPLHRHPVEARVCVVGVVVQRAGVLLVAQHVLTSSCSLR